MANPNPSYLFYDLETSGLSEPFDQAFQFAAIRTDLQFNTLEEHSFYIHLNPDTLPHPKAMLTHGITFDMLESGLGEYDAMVKIHRLFNTPNTISLGYNTLGFDDEFLRFGFYRNLLPPYLHQYKNGCRRMDVYPMAMCYRLFAPHCLKTADDHSNSLKLEHIGLANGWLAGAAHDAMNDVITTIRLAKHLAQTDPAMWDYLAGYFQKDTAMQRIHQLPAADWAGTGFQEGLLLEGRLGYQNQFMCPVVSLGQHQIYKNQQCFLRLDTETLGEATLDDVQPHIWTMNLKLGEPPFLLPPKNKYTALLTQERKALTEQNQHFLKEHTEVLRAIRHHAIHYEYPKVRGVDANARLYVDGFWTHEQNQQAQRFHRMTWEERAQWLKTISPCTMKTLATRLIGRHDPNLLDDAAQDDFFRYLQQCWSDDMQLHDHRGEARACHQDLRNEINALDATDQQTLQTLKQRLEDGCEAYAHT